MLLELWNADGAGGRRTVLFVTHDVDEAMALGDRILVVRSGRQVDDIAVTVSRPRTTDSLLLPEMVAITHKLLHHLGLERGPASGVPLIAASA